MASEERRLHPASPFFVLIGSLKQFAFPLIVLLLTGRGDSNEFLPAVIVGLLALHSIAQYFTFRFHIDDKGVVIRSGVFVKSVVHVPYERIQNVSLKQSIFHRVFGVAEVELEAAGGTKPEGKMRVLSMADATALEALIREHAGTVTAGADAPATPAPPAAKVLLTFDAREIMRLGAISNRGFLVVGALLAAFYQAGSDELGKLITRIGSGMFGWTSSLHLEGRALVAGIVVLVIVGMLLLFAFSIFLALVQYDDFRLTDDGKRLRVERGLFTRVRGSLLRRRIQAFTIREGLFHRWFKRRTLRVDSAAAIGDQDLSLSELVPIAQPAYLDALVADLLGGRAIWPPVAWKSLHPLAWRRRFLPLAAVLVLSAAFTVWITNWWGLLWLVLVPLVLIRARVWAHHAAYVDEGNLIGIRQGWLSRTWRFAETSKLQSVRFTQTPFDRRRGMATVVLDTAGASDRGPPLAIPYLPEADARAIVERLIATT